MLVRLTALACLALVSAHPVEDVIRDRQTNRDIIVRQLEAHKTHPGRATTSGLPQHCDYNPATSGTVFANVDSVGIVGSWGTDMGLTATMDICALNCLNSPTCKESIYGYDNSHCYFSTTYSTVNPGPGSASLFIAGTCADQAANFPGADSSMYCNYYANGPA